MTEKHRPLSVDTQLSFALYAASRSLIRLYQDALRPIGITFPQYLVMLVLYEKNDCTVTEIGSKLKLDSGTLTPLLRRLEAADIVRRTRGDDDERTMHIQLTKKGYGLQEQLNRVSFEVDGKLNISDQERRDLRGSLLSLDVKADDATKACNE